MAVLDLPLRSSAAAAAPPRSAHRTAVPALRLYFGVLAALALLAFLLNLENRFTSAGLFFFAPPLDVIPPLSPARWAEAYALHQQDPIYAACGGTESLADFKLLYLWTWGARAASYLFAAAAAAGVLAALARPRLRAMLRPLAGLVLIGAGWLIARSIVGAGLAAVADLSRYNGGQYRHAVDVVFATATLAMLLIYAARPFPAAQRRPAWPAALFMAALLIDIAFGAMMASRNAGAVWTTWPGYQGSALPPLDQLLSFSPLWLNFTVNQYMLQLVHRVLSVVLWIAAFIPVARAMRRDGKASLRGLALPALLTCEMAAGVATLAAGSSPWLSVAHQAGSAFVLAGALLILRRPEEPARSRAARPLTA